MKITVIGTGYAGLVAGAGFAENGHLVTCVDQDPARIRQLARGHLPLYEPGLEELVLRNLEEERLRFTTRLAEAVTDTLVVFLCLDVSARDDGEVDLVNVFQAAEDVGRAMTGYRIIVNRATCPVGTAERIREIVAGLTEHPFDVVANPVFTKKGTAIDDFMRPDHVVVGCEDVRVEEIMRELYAPFLRTGKPFLVMDLSR